MKEKPGFFSSWLRKADLYGQAPTFLYNGDLACKSRFGGLISILVIVAYALCVVFTIWRYFEKSSSETNINTVFVHDPAGFTITKDTFPFAFGLQDSTATHFIDSQIYTVEATYKYFKRKTVNGTIVLDVREVPLNLIPCSQAELSVSEFNNVDLSNMFCLEEFVKANNSLRILGVYESENWGFIELKFFRCSSDCKTSSEIDEKLAQGFFAINYMDRTVKSNNYSNPVEVYPTSYFTATSTSFSKTVTLRFQDQEIFTHSSIIGYMEPSNLKFTNVKSFVSDINKISSTTPISGFFMIQLRMDQLKVQINRKYHLVYQYLAEFGGMIQVVALSALILTYRLSKTHLTIDLLKTLFKQNSPLDILALDSSGCIGLERDPIDDPNPKTEIPLKFSKILPKGVATRSPSSRIKSSSNISKEPENFTPGFKNVTKKRVFDTLQYRRESQDQPEVSTQRMRLSDLQKEVSELSSPKAEVNSQNIWVSNPERPRAITESKQSSELEGWECPNLQRTISEQEPEDWNLSYHPSNGLGDNRQDYHADVQIIRKEAEIAEKQVISSKQEFLSKTQREDAFGSLLYTTTYLKKKIESLSTCDRIKYSLFPYCMKETDIGDLFDFAHSHIEAKFDMTGLLKIIQNFEKLLQVIFTPEQRLLFDLMPTGTPLNIASDERELDKSSTYMSYEDKVCRLRKAKGILKTIHNSRDASLTDRNLLASLSFLMGIDLRAGSKGL